MTRERTRDDRETDNTSLRLSNHGKMLHRDYSAHFFRWSYARRYINKTDNVLEIGCGVDTPLPNMLFGSGLNKTAASYVGVDLNKLRISQNKSITLHGEFDFVKRYKELLDDMPGKYDVVICMEVLEHLRVDLGAKLLKAACACTKPGGLFIMSTPCYDGTHHAANHIHEYTIDELKKALEKAGFVVMKRFGTFMNVNDFKKNASTEQKLVWNQLSNYFDNDAMSCFFAPMFPDLARNNLWVCTPKVETK